MSNPNPMEWVKATASSDQNCVEARQHDGTIQVRDTKQDGAGPILSFTADEWRAFIVGARSGDFDHLATGL